MTMPPLAGLILAGGEARRLGGVDKAWLDWRGETLFARTQARLGGQVAACWVSANRDPARYAPWLADGRLREVIADRWPDHPGPLAGIASAVPAILASGVADWLLMTPVDTPALPGDIAAQLWRGLQAAGGGWRPAIARHQGMTHWLHQLLPLAATADLPVRLDAGERRVRDWCRAHDPVFVDIDAPADAFANLNRQADFGTGP